MFELSAPWWTFVVRATVVYAALMLLVRLAGKRTVGEFTPFDLVVVLLLAEAAQGALTGGDESVPGGLLLATTLVGLNYAIAFATTRSKKLDRLFEGEAVVIARNGEIDRAAMRRNNVPESDFDEAVRRAGLREAAAVEMAVLETSGEITVVPRATGVAPPEGR